MRKSKFTDEELENLESMGMKPSDIAKKLGVSPAAITQRQAKKRNKASEESKLEPEPEPPKEIVPGSAMSFDELQPGVKFLRNGKPIFVKAVVSKNEVTIEDRFGYKGVIERKYFEDNPGKFARVEQSGIGEIKISGKQIKDLPDEEKVIIVEHFTKEITSPPKHIEELFKPIDESAPNNVEPVHIEMEPVDYTDPDWAFGEKEISDTVLGRREYLDLIDQLLYLMGPVLGDESLRERTKLLAERILFLGINKEVGA